jgi:hypothetical protein
LIAIAVRTATAQEIEPSPRFLDGMRIVLGLSAQCTQ